MLASRVPGGKLARDPDIRARVLSGRGAVELWSGHLDQAARVLESALAAASASGGERRTSGLPWASDAGRGPARTATPRRGPGRRATAPLPAAWRWPPVQHPNPAALVALAWVHLEHYELREAGCRLEQADAALGTSPDKLVGAVACLAAARLPWPKDAPQQPRRSSPARGPGGLFRPGSTTGSAWPSRGRAPPPATSTRHWPPPGGPRRHLAGGRGHPRARVGDCRRRRKRTACTRTRAHGQWRHARPGAPASVAG